MLAVDLLWIVFGIGYIVYKLQKEEHIFTKDNIILILIIFAIFIVPQVIVKLSCDEDNIQTVSNIVVLFTTILFLVLCVYGLASFSISSKYNSKNDEITTYCKERAENIQQELKDAGYNISYLIGLDMRPRSVKSAVEQEIYLVPLYDRKTSRPTTINEVYNGLCKLQRLTLIDAKDKTLAGLIGIPIEYIPLNSNITQTDVRSRKLYCSRKRGSTRESLQFIATQVITSYDIKEEANRQRKVLMVRRILKNLGLSYPESFYDELPSDVNYIAAFDKCFEKQGKVRILMDDAGYHLSIDLINKVAFDPLSPINSVYVNTPAEELYDWLCEKRTAELSGMTWFDKTKFDKLLGCPLVEIPPPKGSTELRAICAVQYCLLKEGLTISLNSLIATLYLCKDKENYIEYQDDFNNFVDKYKRKSNIT